MPTTTAATIITQLNETLIELDHYPAMIMQLLTTNSPKKRIEIINHWITEENFPVSKLQPILDFLEAQKSSKANEGSIGGKAKGSLQTQEEITDQTTLLSKMCGILEDIKTTNTLVVKNKRTKKEPQITYSSPIWVSKCQAPCTKCKDQIDGAAFRWKRDGLYESYHATCVPTEHREVFEAVKGYRQHFQLDRQFVVNTDLN
jgi:hypothetical protein